VKMGPPRLPGANETATNAIPASAATRVTNERWVSSIPDASTTFSSSI
jgi:hypothetical protein